MLGTDIQPVKTIRRLQSGLDSLKSMVLKLARQLANSVQYQPRASKPSGRLYNFLKTVLTASQLSCISPSSSSELQLARSRAGDRGVDAALLLAPSDDGTVPLVYSAFWL